MLDFRLFHEEIHNWKNSLGLFFYWTVIILMLISIEINYSCLTSCSISFEMYQFRVKPFFQLAFSPAKEGVKQLSYSLSSFPWFFLKLWLYIHPLFTFYSSPHVKVNIVYMSKKNFTWINFCKPWRILVKPSNDRK